VPVGGVSRWSRQARFGRKQLHVQTQRPRRFYKPFGRFSSDLTMAPIQVSSHHRIPVIIPRSKYRRDELTRTILAMAWLFIG
jgi:hypothetical protein